VSYDRAGYGASQPATDGRRLAALADDLAAVATASAGPRPVVLVGHSLGGRIAIAAAAAVGANLAGMVLIESSPPYGVRADIPGADPMTLLSVILVLAATAGAAAYFPARRAANADPSNSLRRQ